MTYVDRLLTTMMRISPRREEFGITARLPNTHRTRQNRRSYVNDTCAAWLMQRPWYTSLPAVCHKVYLDVIFLRAHRGQYSPDGLFDRKSASRRSGGVLVECARWRMRRCFLSSDDFETSPILSKRKDASIVAIVGSVQGPWSSIIPVRLPSVRYKASCRTHLSSLKSSRNRQSTDSRIVKE